MQVHTEPNCGIVPREEIVRRFAITVVIGDAKELENLLILSAAPRPLLQKQKHFRETGSVQLQEQNKMEGLAQGY